MDDGMTLCISFSINKILKSSLYSLDGMTTTR